MPKRQESATLLRFCGKVKLKSEISTKKRFTHDRLPHPQRLLERLHRFPFLSVLTAIALGWYLVYLTPMMARKSYGHLIDAQEHFRQDYFTALAQQRGRKYVDGILKIQHAIPRDKAYLLVGGTANDAINYFVRYDLAPRPCHYLGRLSELRNPESLKQFGDLSEYVVISHFDPEGPVLMTVQDLEKLIVGGMPR